MDHEVTSGHTIVSTGTYRNSQWSAPASLKIATRIASIAGVYCGPASVVWIAAVWNAHRSRPYDFEGRLRDKALFPDGPRPFARNLPGFQLNLSQLLLRETRDELRLSPETLFRYDSIHEHASLSGMPVIIRIPSLSIRDGLHYVTLFRSEKTTAGYQFYFQDNGVYQSDVKMPEGISVSVRSTTSMNVFPWGAHRVIIN